MARVVQATDPRTVWATMTWRSLVSIGLVGLLVGVVTYALQLVLLQYVFEPIMCREGASIARCDSREAFASSLAIILGSIVGLIFLVRQRGYRPLLVVLAVGLSMWGVFVAIAALPWLIAVLSISLAFALSYMLYSWLVQPDSLMLSLVLVTVTVVVVRLVLTT